MNQCYFNGDFYQCVIATNPGDTPLTAPTKWRKIQIPAKWRWAMAHLTYAHLLELDGQKDKSMEERQAAMQTERVGLDDLVRREATSERWLERPCVEINSLNW